MNNWWDNLWVWNGWQFIKWIFGFIILFFILLQIWNENTIPDYDKRIINNIKNFRIEVPNLTLPKDFFNKDRTINTHNLH